MKKALSGALNWHAPAKNRCPEEREVNPYRSAHAGKRESRIFFRGTVSHSLCACSILRSDQNDRRTRKSAREMREQGERGKDSMGFCERSALDDRNGRC